MIVSMTFPTRDTPPRTIIRIERVTPMMGRLRMIVSCQVNPPSAIIFMRSNTSLIYGLLNMLYVYGYTHSSFSHLHVDPRLKSSVGMICAPQSISTVFQAGIQVLLLFSQAFIRLSRSIFNCSRIYVGKSQASFMIAEPEPYSMVIGAPNFRKMVKNAKDSPIE
jgi:hypothetical protein